MTTPTASQGASTQASDAKFPIIGIYGVSGCRKTNLRKELEERLGHGRFHYLDGSDAIAKYTEALGEGRPGGLLAFKKGPDSQQKKIREGTIRGIQADCQNMEKLESLLDTSTYAKTAAKNRKTYGPSQMQGPTPTYSSWQRTPT
jgi:hypothetical protein